jgi:DNA-directed RNA polymerase subunit K/omega
VTEELLTPTPPAQPDPKFAVAPQERRFLFVDIAALRAKQLRRGALNRLLPVAGDESPDALPVLPHKAERIAMEEVKRGFIQYELPGPAAVAAKHEPEGDA